MTFRQLCGFLLGGCGAWLMWNSGVTIKEMIEASGGSLSVYQAMLEPQHFLRVITAFSAFIGGLAALVEKKGGAWLAGISSFVFGSLTFGLIANRVDVAHWRGEAVTLVVITGLFLALVVAQNDELRKVKKDLEAKEANPQT